MQHCLYVGTIGEGLFRSTDGGESFIRACEGMFVECHVRALAIPLDQPRTLYLGTEQGLFRSRDGADQWSRVESPLNGRQIWSIFLRPHQPETLLVGTCPARLFRSEDGGHSWSEPRVEMMQECPRIMRTRVTAFAADPSSPETLWAGVEIDGVRRSRDGGRSWQEVGRGLSSRDIHALAVVPREGRTPRLVATTNNDLNVSTDEGETWQPLQASAALPLGYFRALTQLPGRPDMLLLGVGDRPPGCTGLIARSTDGGQTWTPTQMPGRSNSTIWNFAVHPAEPRLVYAGSVSGQVYRSTDAGESWQKLAREFGEIRALAWTP
jgi:photosystem II stability/assembly factor-like uncharacterized protein